MPKTIDNDLDGTLLTFGFDSAVACATDALDRLHTTAESHNRVMVLEVMGRYAGWIAIYAGVAGGADVILIPEIPFTYDSICEKIREREAKGKKFTLVVVAEGAREKDGGFVTSGAQEANREARLGGIGAVVTAELEKRTGKEARCCVLGHLQRGGSPTTFDRVLCSMFGAVAVELIAAGDFGKMVAFTGQHVGSVPIADAVGRLKPFTLKAIWRERRAPSEFPSAIEPRSTSKEPGRQQIGHQPKPDEHGQRQPHRAEAAAEADELMQCLQRPARWQAKGDGFHHWRPNFQRPPAAAQRRHEQAR